MKRLLIIASLSLFPLNIFATEKISFSKESKIEKNHQIEMKEILKEIQDTCHNQNSLLKSALRILRTTLQKSSIHGGLPSDLSDVNILCKNQFGRSRSGSVIHIQRFYDQGYRFPNKVTNGVFTKNRFKVLGQDPLYFRHPPEPVSDASLKLLAGK